VLYKVAILKISMSLSFGPFPARKKGEKGKKKKGILSL
jgi:hypothetical protein